MIWILAEVPLALVDTIIYLFVYWKSLVGSPPVGPVAYSAILQQCESHQVDGGRVRLVPALELTVCVCGLTPCCKTSLYTALSCNAFAVVPVPPSMLRCVVSCCSCSCSLELYSPCLQSPGVVHAAA